jgi:hypothetical protein
VDIPGAVEHFRGIAGENDIDYAIRYYEKYRPEIDFTLGALERAKISA